MELFDKGLGRTRVEIESFDNTTGVAIPSYSVTINGITETGTSITPAIFAASIHS